jgi:hypothetical protein
LQRQATLEQTQVNKFVYLFTLILTFYFFINDTSIGLIHNPQKLLFRGLELPYGIVAAHIRENVELLIGIRIGRQ